MNLGLVITEKHTKLRGLLVLKQKKRKKRREEREGEEIRMVWWKEGSKRVFIRWGGEFSKKKRNLKGDLRRYGKKLREG